MANNFIKISLSLLCLLLISGCARDLSSSTYTSDSTLNIILQGCILSKREVKIKENERLGDNSAGIVAGGLGGGLAAASSGNNAAVVVGGAVVGSLAGAVIQSALGTSDAMEYIVEVDRSKLQENYYEGSRLLRNALAAIRATGIVTIIQSKESKDSNVLRENQNVLVILSEKRTRIIPATH